MPVEITMPQLSDTMSEGTVVKWLKREGDKVNAGETIAEVETDKATMEMEAFESGTLALIDAKEGTKVKVGGRIAVLAASGEKLEDVKRNAGKSSGNGAKPAAAPAGGAAKAGQPKAAESSASPAPAATSTATAAPPR